ncbi:hypothetical protein DPEC_G00332730 [Dallia pectoralis]|uniref:Uncharacterized protein n=1 Tax=Dallia pectoralis TaxID=75939 RepID=A0ACC2F665_DALPE|nr:hypothetical protein DPEC_G00332730 [Dallia pectoralis]
MMLYQSLRRSRVRVRPARLQAPLLDRKKEMEMLKSTCCHKSHPEHTSKDESDQATLRQTLPDLTPDEEASDAPALPAEDLTPTLPAEDPAPPAVSEQPATEGEEPAAAGDHNVEHDGDESPSKSPSKKKKKFRTPSFLKKNKKKTDEKEQKAKEP